MRRGRGIWLLLLLAAACAEVGRPPGGPVDDVPPMLASASPSSLAVGVDPMMPLEFTFSERVDRRRFDRALILVPDVPLENAKFDDLSVRVEPMRPWPADSVVVWVLLPTLPDRHGVAMGQAHTGAFTTGDELPEGQIRGKAELDTLVEVGEQGVDWSQLKARLTLDPLEGQRQRRPWRFADGSQDGSFAFAWIEQPSGPFQVQVWLDRNGDGRRGEREPVATVDSLFVGAADSMLEIRSDLLRLVDLEGPVPVEFCLDSALVDSARVVLWSWTEEASAPTKGPVDSTGCTALKLAPGQVRWGAWLDLDGDLAWSRMEDGSSEPFLPVDTLMVEPAVPLRPPLAVPGERLPWGVVDTLDVKPVPRELWSSSSL